MDNRGEDNQERVGEEKKKKEEKKKEEEEVERRMGRQVLVRVSTS